MPPFHQSFLGLSPPAQILLGVLLAAAVAALAFRVGALTRSGALAAWGVGAAVFGVGGWAWAAALLTFFGTSTVLSRWRRGAKEVLGYEKGGRRDAGQVLANGGVAALCALVPLAFPFGIAHAHLLFLAALAAANADTWATEIGSALGGRPYDLRTGRPAPPGTSGAVSLPGTGAALAGAGLLGLFAGDGTGWAVVTAAGLAGSLLDSLLGATVQARWRDPLRPGLFTERPQPAPPARGLPGVTNDVVNALCTLGAVGLALCLQK